MIAFGCVCGKELKARDEFAGKKTRCPQCSTVLRIPAAPVEVAHPSLPTLERDDEDERSPYALAPTAALPATGRVGGPRSLDRDEAEAASNSQPSAPSTYHAVPSGTKPTRFGERAPAPVPGRAASDPAPQKQVRSKKIKTVGGEKTLLEYSYLLLIFALIPLMFSLLRKDEQRDFTKRFIETLEQAAPEDQQRIEQLQRNESISDDEQIAALPGGRLLGAHLARDSAIHWAYAAIAAVAYLSLLYFCFSVERANVLHLFGIGLFTATVGIVFLLIVQFCSVFRIGRIRGGGVVMIIFLILAIIGWSYSAAEDPDNGFLLSALGFTVGVGLCEEFTKAIPIFFAFRRHCEFGWRTACLWGLASGIGFGVSEGIMYSARHYNGISGVEIYLVRFVSCVALHAMWSASVGIAVARNMESYEGVEDAAGFGLFALRVMAVPMILHGLYDTLLKKDMNALALLVAFLSFGWLAWHVEMARGTHPHPGRPKFAKKWAY